MSQPVWSRPDVWPASKWAAQWSATRVGWRSLLALREGCDGARRVPGRHAGGVTDQAGVPSQGQLRARHRRVSPPANEVPAVVSVRQVLTRGPGVALSLLGARVFSTGVLLELDVRLQRRPTPEQAAGLHEFLRPLPGEGDDHRLVVTVTFADGRSVQLEDLRSRVWTPEREARLADPNELVLWPTPGSSAQMGHARSVALWLGPLPPPGPVVLGWSWPALGVPAGEVVLDGTELTLAGRSAEVLWPWEEDQTSEQLAMRYTGDYLPTAPPR